MKQFSRSSEPALTPRPQSVYAAALIFARCVARKVQLEVSQFQKRPSNDHIHTFAEPDAMACVSLSLPASDTEKIPVSSRRGGACGCSQSKRQRCQTVLMHRQSSENSPSERGAHSMSWQGQRSTGNLGASLTLKACIVFLRGLHSINQTPATSF